MQNCRCHIFLDSEPWRGLLLQFYDPLPVWAKTEQAADGILTFPARKFP